MRSASRKIRLAPGSAASAAFVIRRRAPVAKRPTALTRNSAGSAARDSPPRPAPPGSDIPDTRREDSHLEGRARRRAEAGNGPLRGSQGIHGAPRRPRSGRITEAPGSGARSDDGGRALLRGHGQPGDGRRDHGALRRAALTRGPRRARLLRGPPDAGLGEAVCGGGRQVRGRADPHPRRAQLRRSGRRSIGNDLHMDYTAVGQTTHLAARMEQTALPDTILIPRDDAEPHPRRPSR